MTIYTKLLILVDTQEEANAINSDANREDMWHDRYAIVYGDMSIGMRYEDVEIRYEGVRNSDYEAREIAQGLRKDLERGFNN